MRCSLCGRPRASGCGCARRTTRPGTGRSTTLGSHAPIALWTRGEDAALAALADSIALVGARAATGYGEHVTMESLRRARRSRIRDRLGRRVRHRRHGAPRRAREPRPDDRVPGRRGRPLLPERARRAAHPDRRRGLRGLRAAVRLAADEVAVPAAQPAYRGREPRDRGARGGLALGIAQHGAPRRRARAAARRGAWTGDESASAGCHRLLRESAAICVTGPDEMAELARPGVGHGCRR